MLAIKYFVGDVRMIILEDKERKYDDILTVKELMDFLAIGKNTAYELLKSGEIKSFRIGRCYKVPKKSVLEYVQRRNY